MELQADFPLQKLALVIVDQINGHLTVELLDDMVALADNLVGIPLTDIDSLRLFLGENVLLAAFIDHHLLATGNNDATPAHTLTIDHRSVGSLGMNITLITPHRKRIPLHQRAAIHHA